MEVENVNREELLDHIKRERAHFEEILSRVDPADYLNPVFDGGWSVKDVLAHIVLWEQLMITWVSQAAEGIIPEVPGSDENVEAINQKGYQDNKDLAWEDVDASFRRSYSQALSIAENAPDEVIFTENPLPGRKQPFWITIAANTWWHYKEHRQAFERWLDAQSA
ncbi:MAG: DinB family protein [Chloroflexota bacterium]